VQVAPPSAQKGWVYQRTVPVTDTYELGKELGRGSYGVTRIAIDKKTGKQYACKTLSKRRIWEEAMEQDVRTEIQVSSRSDIWVAGLRCGRAVGIMKDRVSWSFQVTAH
jgi:serine/threonine protein kinase